MGFAGGRKKGPKERDEDLKKLGRKEVDEQDIRRLESIADEARIKNKIMHARIMNDAVVTSTVNASQTGDKAKLSGDGPDPEGQEDIVSFTIEKEKLGKGNITELGSIIGSGSQLSFTPAGDVNVSITGDQIFPVLSRAIQGEGSSGVAHQPPAHDSPTVDMHTTIREIVTRRAVDRFVAKSRRKGLKPDEANTLRWLVDGQDKQGFRRWLAPGLSGFNKERLQGELVNLNKKADHEDLTDAEKEQKAWIMQQIGWRLNKKEKRELGYDVPDIRDREGALKYVKPYLHLTTWDVVPSKYREAAFWWREQVLLRSQHNIVRRWNPKKYKMWWAQKKKKSTIEGMFDDMDEEIYSKKWFKDKGRMMKELEDMEEEITGYDSFTVQEEKQMKKMYDNWVKEQQQWERLQEAY
ncbi:hypothetical protein ACFLRF_03685 [Candidatus Altiarchaeota archaeon]